MKSRSKSGNFFVTVITSAFILTCRTPMLENGSDLHANQEIFLDRAAEAGLQFSHVNGASGRYYFCEIVGSGCAFFDFDNDGDLDIYLVQSGSPEGVAARNAPTDKLFRNDGWLDENGVYQLGFTDVTETSGIVATGYGMGVAAGDVDNDGWTDLYVTQFGANRLWRNRGNGTFQDITERAGVDDPRWSTSAAFLDYDRDGFLDLFVVNYTDFRLANHKECVYEGALDYCGPLSFRPLTDRLFRNRGDGSFEDLTGPAGILAAPGTGLGVVCADFNGDGLQDIYVANDKRPNHLWLNLGDGRFENDALYRGNALDGQGQAEASMGVDAADFDGDGDEDLFMTHLVRETNTLYLNDGKGFFTDHSVKTGLGPASFAYTGFGCAFLDFDNDGRQDIFSANGAVKAVESLKIGGDPFPYAQADQLFQNLGEIFTEISHRAPVLVIPAVSRGIAVGDVDNDGDPDVLINDNNGPVRLLINQVGQKSHWLGLRLVSRGGRDMLGARIAVYRPNRPPLWRRVRSDASYLSANDPRVLVGLGASPLLETVKVVWPDGAVEQWTGLPVDRYSTLVKGTGAPYTRNAP